MTRDEAIIVVRDSLAFDTDPHAAVDCFVALGMLKLDEPKSTRDKFNDALLAMGYDPKRSFMKEILSAFDAASSAGK